MPLDPSLIKREAQQAIEKLDGAVSKLDAIAQNLPDFEVRKSINEVLRRDLLDVHGKLEYLRDLA